MSIIESQIISLEALMEAMRMNEKLGRVKCGSSSLENRIKAINDAILTIKKLSEKLAAANMERSRAYYNGGWIPVEKRLPEFTVTSGSGDEDLSPKVLASIVYGDGSTDVTMSRCHRDGTWSAEFFSVPKCKVVAWAPLPEPYKGEKENGDD